MGKGGIQLVDTFLYSGKQFLDKRKECKTLAELKATDETSIPDGFTKYVAENDRWYKYHKDNPYTEETGRWQGICFGREVLNDDFIYGIVDKNGNLLFGIRHDGSVYQPKGIPEAVQERFNELSCIQVADNDQYIFGIVDCLGNLLFGIDRTGKVIVQNGMSLDCDGSGVDMMHDENYLFAILDAERNLLFGITHNGEVVFDKGIPTEFKIRLDEMKGYQLMSNEDFIYAITDSNDRLLFGIRRDGTVVVTKGIVEIVTWEQYQDKPRDDNILYVIEAQDGSLQGTFLNGRPLATGEEYGFIREANMLIYHGRMTSLPNIWIDHENMQLMVDYPSDYSGPIFINEDGMLFVM